MEEFIYNYNFPKDFVNIIIIGKNWKQKDLITYYLELLPKDTKVVTMNKYLDGLTGLKLDIHLADWKKDGRFAKQKKLDTLIKNRVDLITVFGKNNLKLGDILTLQIHL